MHFICIVLILNEGEHLLILLVILIYFLRTACVFFHFVFIIFFLLIYNNFTYIKKVSPLSSICYTYLLHVHLLMSMLMVISCQNFYVVLYQRFSLWPLGLKS